MDYPANLEFDAPARVANWRPLVQWLLALPHLLIANVLGDVGGVLALIGWFAIVFTGNLPEGIANFQCLVLRYQQRAYNYALFLREDYPAFEFSMTAAEPGGDPLRIDFRPEIQNRNRLTVGLRFLWIIPIALFALIMTIAAAFVVFVGFFAVLFTGQWPEGMRRFVIQVARLQLRVSAYGYLLVDEYPPFALA